VLSVNVDCAVCDAYPLDYPAKPRFIGAKLSATFN